MAALTSVSSSFDAFSATSSSSSVASVTVGNGAVAGSYALEVESLATGSKVATKLRHRCLDDIRFGRRSHHRHRRQYLLHREREGRGYADGDSRCDQLAAVVLGGNQRQHRHRLQWLASGSVLRNHGEGTDLHVSGTGDLAALDINNTFDEDGKRVLSKQSGTDAGYITLSSNASYTLDGLELSSSTNTVTALSGLTIKLTGEGSSTLTVGANTEGLKTSVESFVTAYNTLITVTNALTRVSATDDGSSTEAGAMVGDASVRSLLTSIRSALSDTSGASGNLNVLAQLGVTTNKDGTLAIDDAKLTSSLESNYADVKEFFAGSNGLLSRLGDVTSAYTASGGLLDTREKNIQSTLNDLASQQEALDRRIESVTASLYTKYNNMDMLVAQLQATSESILATLNALNNKDS